MADAGGETDVTRADAVWRLAQRLHFKMEHLDPTEDEDWEKMDERRRQFYRLLVEDLLCERALLATALYRRLDYRLGQATGLATVAVALYLLIRWLS